METQTAEPATVEELPEDRIDERAINAYQYLGYTGRLPDALVQIHNDFKRVKDRLSPGPLTAEGYAMILTLYNLAK